MSIKNNRNNVKALFALEPDERIKALSMFLYNFILLNTLYLLKPVRDSLFLEQVGAHSLPFVFILTAIAVIPISVGYSRIAQRMSVGWVINIVTLFLAANLFLIWSQIDTNSRLLYYGFYIWVSIYGVLITSQFWLFANTIFNSVQARKVFGFLSMGAIAGAFTGGEMTGLLINQYGVSPKYLLLISVVMLVATVPLISWILTLQDNPADDKQMNPAESSPVNASANPIKEILNNKHLLLITGLIGTAVVVTTIIDFQFKSVAESAFASEAALTSFMGRFYGRVSLIAFLLQFFVGTYFTKKYGVSGAVLLLPVALLISAGGMLLIPGLIAGTISRGVDQSLKHSIDRTGRELLFIPLKTQLKKRVKVFVDLFVDHGAQGLAGILLTGLTFGLGFGVRELSLVVVTLLLLWIIIAKMVSNSYIDQFRKSLRRQVNSGRNRSSDEVEPFNDISYYSLLRLLKSGQESDILTALERFRQANYELPEKHLRKLLKDPREKIRLETLKLLREKELPGFVDNMIDLVYDPNPDIRMETIRYIYQFCEGDWLGKLHIGLEHEDVRVRAAAFGLIAEEGGAEERELITDRILKDALDYKGEEATELRRQTAKVLGKTYTSDRAWMLKILLQDEAPSVVNEAIISAGETMDRQFTNELIWLLGDELHRKTAEQALGRYGESIFGALYDHMNDNELPESIRQYIPWLFSQTVSEESWRLLVMSLERCSIPVRHGVIKALLRLRSKDESFTLHQQVTSKNINIEIARYSKLMKVLHMYQGQDLVFTDRVADIIEYEINQSFENIFRLLCLTHNREDITNAYRGITGHNSFLRADAIEFIENLIAWETRKLLLPILEKHHSAQLHENSFNTSVRTKEEAFSFLINLDHSALKSELDKNIKRPLVLWWNGPQIKTSLNIK